MNEISALRAENDELRERIRQLEATLLPDAVEVPLAWGLSASETRMFRHLASRAMVTRDSMMEAMFFDRIDDWPSEKIVDVFICKLRRKTTRHGVRITTVWGQGWRLEDRGRYRRQGGG